MTRSLLRRGFGLVLALGVGLFVVMAFAALTPKPVPILDARDEAVAKIAEIDGEPVFVAAPDLTGLAHKAWDLRAAAGPGRPMGAPKITQLPIYLVRDGDGVRAFIGIDPRNGCRLALDHIRTSPNSALVTIFHDVCHGSLYDLSGAHIGGPSPWALDELVASVRQGVVYIDRKSVIPGRWVAR